MVLLPTALFNLHPPGLIFPDLVFYFFINHLFNGCELGIAPVINRLPFDGILNSSVVGMIQRATFFDHLAVIQARDRLHKGRTAKARAWPRP